MRRLVVVSNRLPSRPPGRQDEDRRMPVGGLASALRGALRRRPGSLWFGWSGTVASSSDKRRLHRQVLDGIQILGLPMSEREVVQYYRGFCNAALWPLFHCFQGRVLLNRESETTYRDVNARFAAALLTFLQPGDLVWVHDYHFLCFGRELRRLGWRGPLGFFLHVPFPPHDLWQVLPEPRDFLQSLLEYDVIGFQTSACLENYVACCARELGASWEGPFLKAGGRLQRAAAYPIGIDPHPFLPREGVKAPGQLARELSRIVRGRRLILGVDRLDYTKGIPERILAFEKLVTSHPQWRKRVSLVQIASPSRSRVAEYVEQKSRVDSLVGRVNGELAEHDWVPIRYLYRSYPPETLAGFYRSADVGLVTPLRDGMNLIAKEFVAAQNPEFPGVLVLSRFAGAAEQLTEAVLVNPYIAADAAEGIARALAMPLEQRRERHAALLAKVLRITADDWSRRFLEDLERAPAAASAPARRRPRRRTPAGGPA